MGKKFRVELTDGRKFDVEVEGDQPPTEDELLAYIDAQPKSAGGSRMMSELAAMQDPAMLADIQRGEAQGGADIVRGMLKGAGRTAYNIARGASFATPLPDLPPSPEGLQPVSAAEQLGHGVEQAVEFFAPAGAARKVAAMAGPAVGARAAAALRALTDMMGSGALSAAQGNDAAAGAAASATGQAASAGVSAVGRAAGKMAAPLVRSAIKPTVTEMKQTVNASQTGINAQADRLVKFILDNEITDAAKAQSIIEGAEREIQRLVGSARGVTDAPQRAERYLRALSRSAARQGLPADDVATIRGKAAELLNNSPLSEDVVTTVMRPSPSGLVDASGQPVMAPAQETSRALRTDVSPQEALEIARGSGKWGNRKAWGEQKGAAREASKAVERATRDSLKEAVPGAREQLQRQGNAIQAKKVLDRKEFREANREPISPFDVTTAAVEIGQGRVPLMAFANAWLRENKLRAGVWGRRLEQAIRTNDAKTTAEVLGRFGVNVVLAPSPAQ